LYILLGYDSDQAQAYDQYLSYADSNEHKGKISHELIAAAASYAAAEAYEAHVAQNGLSCPVAPSVRQQEDVDKSGTDILIWI
jgi:hypothetical protein